MAERLIVADVFERASGIPERLEQLGVAVHVRRLRIGDYDVNGRLVERKSVGDFHGAVIRGRFWSQIGGLRNATRRPYLILEGPDVDGGPLRPESVRGALLALAELDVHVLRTSDPIDSALLLFLLAGRNRTKTDRPTYAQRPKRRSDSAEAMLAAVPGISSRSARALLDRFGSVEATLTAGPAAWCSVPGIGPKRAAALAETLAHCDAGASRGRSPRPGPST